MKALDGLGGAGAFCGRVGRMGSGSPASGCSSRGIASLLAAISVRFVADTANGVPANVVRGELKTSVIDAIDD
jgi:hypothetical protein